MLEKTLKIAILVQWYKLVQLKYIYVYIYIYVCVCVCMYIYF